MEIPNQKASTDIVGKVKSWFGSNKIVAPVILLCAFFIWFDNVTGALENTLRRFNIIESFTMSKDTRAGDFSCKFFEDARYRLFWIKEYTEAFQNKNSTKEQESAFDKYINASANWSSQLNYYKYSVNDFYGSSEVAAILKDSIPSKFQKMDMLLKKLKYRTDTVSNSGSIKTINTLRGNVDSILTVLATAKIDHK